jgi:glycosyltransferase involved in cell wall biosynthesis
MIDHGDERTGRKPSEMWFAANGWSLRTRPTGPEALHLLEIMEQLPSGALVVPGSGAEPDLVHRPTIVVDIRPGPLGRLFYEQVGLPAACGELGVQVLYTHAVFSPIRSRIPVVATAWKSRPTAGLGWVDRVRHAAGLAGMAGASASLRYADLHPEGAHSQQAVEIPPLISASFRLTSAIGDGEIRKAYGLPETYVLSHLSGGEGLEGLIAAWSWVAGSVGESFPLVLLGLSDGERENARAAASKIGVDGTVLPMDRMAWPDLPAVYRGAACFFHTGPTYSGQEFRWAMASGLPIACDETAASSRLLGDSAYMAPAGDSRALGAACLSLLVEPQVADPLRQRGLARSATWATSAASQTLLKVLAHHAGDPR